jgi:protein-disulfide isomerase
MTRPPAALSEQDHVRGPQGAPALLVYGDYECPYTRMAHRSIEAVRALVQLHPHALHAALAAEAAGRQDRFWEMHDLLFHRQKALADEDLRRYAGTVGLDLDAFAADVAGRAGLDRIEENLASGLAAGVRGTPALFLDGAALGSYDADALAAALGGTPDGPAGRA